MFGCLISFLFFVLVVIVVLFVIRVGLEALGFSVPDNIVKIVGLILALIALLYVVQCLLGGGGGALPQLRIGMASPCGISWG